MMKVENFVTWLFCYVRLTDRNYIYYQQIKWSMLHYYNYNFDFCGSHNFAVDSHFDIWYREAWFEVTIIELILQRIKKIIKNIFFFMIENKMSKIIYKNEWNFENTKKKLNKRRRKMKKFEIIWSTSNT